MNKKKKKAALIATGAILGIACATGVVMACRSGSVREIVPVRQESKEAKWTEAYEKIEKPYSEFVVDMTPIVFEEGGKNQCYSPLSLYYSLGVLAYGAEGETEEELLNLLNVSDKETLAAQYGEIYRMSLMIPYKPHEDAIPMGATMDIGTSLWLDNSLSYKKEYVHKLAENFYTPVYQVNLGGAKAQKSMENWLSEKTGGQIKLGNLGDVPDKGLMLLNTVTFADFWYDSFDPEDNTKEIFYTADGREIECEFINQEDGIFGLFSLAEEEQYIAVTRRLGKSYVSFVLPEEGVNPADLLADPETVRNMIYPDADSLRTVKATWHMPKFTTESAVDCKAVVEKAGIKHLTAGCPDLGGITDEPVSIDGMKQVTRIGMDENGVTVASAAGIVTQGVAQYEWIDVNLNRPFIYIIYGRGGVVAIGVCDDPTAQ